MSMVDKIIMEAGLNELDIRKKTQIGQGVEHEVYPSLRDSNVVIKTGWNIDKFAEASAKHPDVVAQVYKVGRTHIVVEKLDTDTLVMENNVIVKALNMPDAPLSPDDRPVYDAFAMLSINLYTESEYFEILSAYLEQQGGVVRDIWHTWEPFLKRIEALDLDGDAATRNVGYDQSGRLKLLDI